MLREKIEFYLIDKHLFRKSIFINLSIMAFFVYIINVFNLSILGYLVVVVFEICYLIKYLIIDWSLIKIVIEKLIALSFCVWLASVYLEIAPLGIGAGVFIIVLITIFMKLVIKKWWSFSLYYLFSLIISAYSSLFALSFLVEDKKIDDITLGIIILLLTIISILSIVITEKREHILREMKVGTYCCIAIISTITAGMFYIEEVIATEFSDFVKNELEEDLELEDNELEETKILKIKNRVSQYEDINEILEKSPANTSDDSNLLLYILYEYIDDQAKSFISKLINIILFPYLIMGVWCTFIIELKERNIYRNKRQLKTVRSS